MFLRFSILFLALLFAANLWLSVNYAGYAGWFGIVFSIVIILLSRIVTGRWKFSVLPAVLVPGAVLLLSLIDPPFEMALFIILSTLVYYFAVLAGWRLFQYEKDETAKAIYDVAAVAALFCWYTAFYGWYLNPSISFSSWLLLAIFSLITFLVASASYSIHQIRSEKYLTYSVFLAIFIAQAVWVQNFWPFGYLTIGAVTLIIYFISWEMILSFFLEKLTIRTFLFEILFLAGSVAFILLSTKWYPII